MKIFVARLPYQFKEADIAELFAPYGEVNSVNLIMDRETGRSKCFAFVEMPDDEQANMAIDALNEKQILDKAIAVSQAKEKERTERPAGGGGYRGGNGGGGYRGGNSGGSG
jgi:RNA recognition motif-containing protein